MDTESPRINEEALHEMVSQLPSAIMGAIGMEALTVLAREMPTEKFHEFIAGAVDRAKQIHAGVQKENGQQQAPEGNQGQ